VNELAAILLAGGRGSRMGGVHKPLLEVGGSSLLDAAAGAAREAGADPIVVVGPVDTAHADLTWVREDPPFGGPAAAILAALPRIASHRTLVLACDLPAVAPAVRALLAAPFEGDGLCLVDSSGRSQWLIGLYRTAALREAAAMMPADGQDAPVRALLGSLAITGVAASADLTSDIDTWDDLQKARERTS
jgi:molybdopterin-guanine dinucleotide biosynthesis protein A